MPYFLEFSPGYGLHLGYLPGVPTSHGCIRMPYWKARQFYDAAHLGTLVVINLKKFRAGARQNSFCRQAAITPISECHLP
jgi:hypothetical protein